MKVYVCESDDYVVVKRGQKIIVRGKVAENEDGDTLNIDLNHLMNTPEHFRLESGGTDVKQPEKDSSPNQKQPSTSTPGDINPAGGYAVVRRIGKIHKTLSDAKSAAERKGAGTVYVVQIVNTVEIVHNVNFKQA